MNIANGIDEQTKEGKLKNGRKNTSQPYRN